MSPLDSNSSANLKEMLERALAFTERLLSENARLRRSLATSHAGTIGPSVNAVDELKAEVERLGSELARRDHASTPGSGPMPGAVDVEALRRDLMHERRQRLELEEQNNSLANLYVASHQLHSTLDFKEVVTIVMEIVINLVGAERFALLLVDGRTTTLQVVAAEGLELPAASLPLGEGVVGEAARSGVPWFRAADQAGHADIANPLAVIPLKIQDRVLGVISVWALLPHKKAFGPLDHELFNLLAGHAATAIFSAKLHGDAERKLSTIQGFLDLLTTG